jgi:hypothetical protein
MATTQTSPRESAPPSSSPDRTATPPHRAPSRPSRVPTDDEILGLDSGPSSAVARQEGPPGRRLVEPGGSGVPGQDPWRDVVHSGGPGAEESLLANGAAAPSNDAGRSDATPLQQNPADSASPNGSALEPENLRAAFDANPALRQAWHDAHSYRESFATPDEARAATALLADLDRLDALFYSRHPEDHAELARAVAALDPDAFASLARAMSSFAGSATAPAISPPRPRSTVEAQDFSPAKNDGLESPPLLPQAVAVGDGPEQQHVPRSGPTPAQAEFFHSANAAAVRNVLDAIESQVERLLPEGVSKSARNRVVGEIYRELDSTLQSNRQLAQQMRDAFKSGALDANHQRAVVSLITGRARQALPGVAKRVLGEWTSTIVAANHDRRSRQRAAESRVDIAGSGRAGNDAIRPMSPRDIDYARLSDSDILNM